MDWRPRIAFGDLGACVSCGHSFNDLIALRTRSREVTSSRRFVNNASLAVLAMLLPCRTSVLSRSLSSLSSLEYSSSRAFFWVASVGCGASLKASTVSLCCGFGSIVSSNAACVPRDAPRWVMLRLGAGT